MVDVELSASLKVARLNDREFRCLVTGVWPLAAKAEPRGYLVVAGGAATDRDVAHQARCSVPIAKATLARLRTLGMLERHDNGFEYCHDWHELNPDPSPSSTREAWRDRKRKSRNGHDDVTRDKPVKSQPMSRESPETEVKEKGRLTSSLRSDVVECFAYWQERCGHPQAKLTADRRGRIEARLREDYSVHDIRQAIEGAARAPFVDENGKRHDDIELICRKGSKLEDFKARATAPLRAVPAGLIDRRSSTNDLLRKLRENEAS